VCHGYCRADLTDCLDMVSMRVVRRVGEGLNDGKNDRLMAWE